MVTFQASEHHRPSTSSKLYCLVTEAGVRERRVQGSTRQCNGGHGNFVIRRSILKLKGDRLALSRHHHHHRRHERRHQLK